MKRLPNIAFLFTSLFSLAACATNKNEQPSVIGRWESNVEENISNPHVEFKENGVFWASFLPENTTARWKEDQMNGHAFYHLYDEKEDPENSKHFTFITKNEDETDTLTIIVGAHGEVTFSRIGAN